MTTEKSITRDRDAKTATASGPFDPMPYSIERHIEIQELAYRKARARGFAPGFEEPDWLAAEREISV